jgi:hypothetical protein
MVASFLLAVVAVPISVRRTIFACRRSIPIVGKGIAFGTRLFRNLGEFSIVVMMEVMVVVLQMGQVFTLR